MADFAALGELLFGLAATVVLTVWLVRGWSGGRALWSDPHKPGRELRLDTPLKRWLSVPVFGLLIAAVWVPALGGEGESDSTPTTTTRGTLYVPPDMTLTPNIPMPPATDPELS